MDQYRTHKALRPEEEEQVFIQSYTRGAGGGGGGGGVITSVHSADWRGKHNSLSEHGAIVLALITRGASLTARRGQLRRFRLAPQFQAGMMREIAAIW